MPRDPPPARRDGFRNVVVMIPFCRSTKEADQVLAVMAEYGLKRGENGLEVYVMCETPSNVILASAFAKRFDGFSIGSNDLTQLTLGVDRNSADLAQLFDEQDEAVKSMIENVIREAHKAGAKVGLCGQAPSDHPEFGEFLVRCGINSMSVSPDSFIAVKEHVAAAETNIGGAAFEPTEENPMLGFSRRLALLLAALSRRLRARMPRDPPPARRDGISAMSWS